MSWETMKKTADSIRSIPNFIKHDMSMDELMAAVEQSGSTRVEVLGDLYNLGFVRGYRAAMKQAAKRSKVQN